MEEMGSLFCELLSSMKISWGIWSHQGNGSVRYWKEIFANHTQVRLSLQKKLVVFIVLLESYLIWTLNFALVERILSGLHWEVESRANFWRRATLSQSAD